MHKIDITKSALKFIKNLPPKQYRQVVGTIFSLREDPTPHDSEQLRGYPDYRRVDIGEFRIIYRSDKECIYVAVVGKRNDDEIYRQFKRRTK